MPQFLGRIDMYFCDLYKFVYLLYLIWSKSASAIKGAENVCAAMTKKWATKAVLDRNKLTRKRCRSWIGVSNKTIILLGLAGNKMTKPTQR